MLASRTSRALAPLAVAALVALAACGGGDTTSPKNTPAALTVISGNLQSGVTGGALGQPLVVKVTTSSNSPVAGANVDFQVTSGTAAVQPSRAVTDAAGEARATLTLGANPGQVEVTATVSGTALTQKFVATALSAGNGNCTAATATTLAVGQVVTPVTATSICVSGGTTGAEFALIPFHATAIKGSTTSLEFTASGTDPVSSPAASRSPVDGPALGTTSPLVPNERFETALREREQVDLAPRLAAARAWMRSRASSPALRDAIPSNLQVGQLVRLNTQANVSCSNIQISTGRVVAIGQKSIVIADTANPAGGFTDDEYRALGVTFDTLVHPLVARNYADVSNIDIDKNGHIVIFYTKAVNELTPRSAGGSFVGGFFYARDLFPISADDKQHGLQACAGSNFGEMFYLLVPDPTGTINGNKRTKEFVAGMTTGTLAHEYQHLVNAEMRAYGPVNALDWEDVFLNEGLSHMAEELMFYYAGRTSPRQNLTAAALRASQAAVDAFNAYQLQGNFGRYRLYLRAPTTSSALSNADSLENRGAIWSFLRYLADHRAPTGTDSALTPDGDFWFKLVNSPYSGVRNLQQVLGTDPFPLMRDWTTSLLTDDLPGVDPRYQQLSWNFRDIWPQVGTTIYPLQTISLLAGSPSSVTLGGGSSAYVRFAVGAGRAGGVSWGVPAGAVTVTLVRTK